MDLSRAEALRSSGLTKPLLVGLWISDIELIQNQIIFAKRKNLDEHKAKMTA